MAFYRRKARGEVCGMQGGIKFDSSPTTSAPVHTSSVRRVGFCDATSEIFNTFLHNLSPNVFCELPAVALG